VPAETPAPRRPAGARTRLALAVVLAAGLAGAIGLLDGPTGASRTATGRLPSVASQTRRTIESMFQDDRLLVDSPTSVVTRTLDTLAALGVDRLRITVQWASIAPDPDQTTAPAGFDPTDPASYPAGGWAPYDRVVKLAHARHLKVDFDLTAPGPLWAMQPGAPELREANHFGPSASDFGQFVHAVGVRYSGHYRASGHARPLPHVRYWSIWNEPNQPGWLAPQADPGGTLESAVLYRGFVDAAFAALGATGHRHDTFLIGELAPEGSPRPGRSRPLPPIPFLRALYCVGPTNQPLAGNAASLQSCPSGGSPSAFVAAHPGLFAATGFAHHPYSFFLAPGVGMTDTDFVPLSDLSRLQDNLDAIFNAYSVTRKLPLYLTEYGYETNPPNPFRGVTPGTQAAYLDQAEYMAWSDPRVRTLSQFLLEDSAPDTAYPKGSVRYWSTFQTGLAYLNGVAKPSLFAYRIPVYVPDPVFARGQAVTVWGMLRLAPNGTQQHALLEWRPSGRGTTWRGLEIVVTSNRTGVLLVSVKPPGSGWLRLSWTSAAGQVANSRPVRVRLSAG
jgi:hypothetical protein